MESRRTCLFFTLKPQQQVQSTVFALHRSL
jgi:hypothetical protein